MLGNPQDAEASVMVSAYEDSGRLRGIEYLTVAGNGNYVGTVSHLFHGKVRGTGWLEVRSDTDIVASELFVDGTYGGCGAAPAAETSHDLVLPHFVHSNRWWTGLSVVNTGFSSTAVTVTAYANSGVTIDQTVLLIPEKGKISGMIQELLPKAANGTGWISLSSNPGPVCGLLVYGDKGSVPNRIAALTGTSGRTQISFSQFLSDPNAWTGLAIVNPSDAMDISIRVTGYGPEGTLIDQVSGRVLGPCQKIVGVVDQILNLKGTEAGWVEAIADFPVAGCEILNVDDASQDIWGLAGIEGQVPSIHLYFPHFDWAGRWWTLFAVANPHSTEAVTQWMGYDSGGHQVDPKIWVIPAHGSMAELVEGIMGF